MRTAFVSLSVAALSASLAVAEPAGYSAMSFDAPHHGRGVIGAIWYPVGGPGRAFVFAENPVFHGITVVEEAPVMDGEHPVVMLSHGMGGNVRSLAWLASGLAERGAIVVSVNHPNSTWGDFDLAAGLQHWTRVQDLSLALDTLLADPRFDGHFDMSRVMAAGFSYGGWTALSMGGVLGNHAGYVDHCEMYGAASSHCDDLMGAQVRLADVDGAVWNASYADGRVTSVVAIDPGLTWGLSADDLRGMVSDVRVIGLGEGDDRLLATDFDASGFAVMVPSGKLDVIAPAFHFSGLPLCKEMGAAILREEGDDPVCSDPEGADRAEIHRQIIDAMAADLGL